jgi:hypothetical protein
MRMKVQGLIVASVLAITACNRTGTEQVEKIKSLAERDSLRAAQANEKDSLITAYLDDLNQIQDNLDRIKEREKIITMQPLGDMDDKQMTITEIRELDDWIVSNDKKMNDLQMMLKKMDTKNTKLESLVAHLTRETTEKDEEISELQAKLSKANDSVRLVTARFNDSIGVIQNQRAQISELSAVYYITGTMKDLKDEGIIDKKGGFIGMGRVAVLNSLISRNKFTKTNPLSLKGFSLHGKFRRMITMHPDQSYKIIAGSKTDSLSIVMPSTFWGESKYLAIAIK